uniref:Ferredoxin n=1 Tax=Thermosporothrix sp. COM3 TaxID=2490863 RepID=A0A455SH95_9CHLR|nr:ferredoxin [Thermosporothrix sp. COM3]
MKVTAFTDRCIASGSCVLACPQVFDQRETDGVVRVLQERPPLELLEKVKNAAFVCPAQVFTVEDEENTSELIVVEDDSEQA